MDWGQHVSDISSKATKTHGFLRRNLAFAPRSTKEVAYITFVRPKLKTATFIWISHLKLQIEKVQRTAARWTCRRWRNTSSVGECLVSLNGHPLRPEGTSPPCFSITSFIVAQCLLKKTSSFCEQRSLGHSLFKQKFSQKNCAFFFFFFIKISK